MQVRDRKGQALVEFVIILPILLLIVISMIDFGNLLYQKYQLEQDLEYISDLYIANDTNALEQEKQKLHVTTVEDGSFVTLQVQKEANLASPILRRVLGDHYQIETSRKLYLHEEEEQSNSEEEPEPSPSTSEEEDTDEQTE